MSSDPNVRKLKIKTGVCKRLEKDLLVYEKEKQLQQDRIQELKQSSGDVYVIKKQEEVLSETISIIPDTKNRLASSLRDLIGFMEDLKNQYNVELEEWREAVEIRERLEQLFDTPL